MYDLFSIKKRINLLIYLAIYIYTLYNLYIYIFKTEDPNNSRNY